MCYLEVGYMTRLQQYSVLPLLQLCLLDYRQAL